MAALITGILLALSGNILLLASLLFFLFAQILLHNFMPQADLAQVLLFTFLGLAIPFAALLASLFIEKASLPLKKFESLSSFCFVVTCALCLQSEQAADFFAAGLRVLQMQSVFGTIGFITMVSNASLMAGCMVALAVLSIEFLFEIPAAWFCGAFGFKRQPAISFETLRPIGVLTILFIGLHFIMAFLSAKLWPDIFLR